ncbi:MAG TPA: aminomethyl-transferring glycine dehydrogenase [Phycisphaerae bacterium]|nr:aminomethyl-transferring glycine dehydrogenase [Phycisphaerae bacterium]
MREIQSTSDNLEPIDTFVHRHIGPSDADIGEMLQAIGYKSLDELTDATIPADIRLREPLSIGEPRGEHELLGELKTIASKNKVFRSMIGMGYYGCITPPVILRNVLENPGWYTQYTPYQAEIAQGRLEALLNFQTMVADLTGLPLASASLLDEATAAAEAMTMCHRIVGDDRMAFFVAEDCHPQTIAVIRTRAEPLGIKVTVGDPFKIDFEKGAYFGVLLQYPTTYGNIERYDDVVARAHATKAMVAVATDLLALTLIRPPGEWGADIAVGNSQRFGVPMGFGGPHAAFMSTRDEFARQMPGRIVGVSRDAQGRSGYRLAIQTREQHIRREKATSNICTAQVLLAIMASMYAVYHGPGGLRRIAYRIHAIAEGLRSALKRLGHEVATDAVFDTLRVRPSGGKAQEALRQARERSINLRDLGDGWLALSVDETTGEHVISDLLAALGGREGNVRDLRRSASELPDGIARTSPFLTHSVFNAYHSETEMLRYIFALQQRDLSLASAMIPLGSCTMKLNATSEMIPVTWPEFAHLHPYAPPEQTQGYAELFQRLEGWLADITGFAAVSLQPNAGSQGEYAGLLAIRGYHRSRNDQHRDVCLIPVSAHGTNAASAVMAGMKVVAVAIDAKGAVDVGDLKAKAQEHRKDLSCLMVTYPSTAGIFEEGIAEICRVVHENGGQVYMDGANMNAQVGLCRPGDIGSDVCHLNLHKTFCIPHGGGGPGMGPICVAAHLAPFLPGHPASVRDSTVGPVSAAPYGSPAILPISYVYIALMGSAGLRKATQVAILNANYMAQRLEGHYPIVYRGRNGRVAHEFIVDCRPFDKSAGVKIDDIAKRLIDYGFHAPTMSFPVAGTLMIEPTESESKAELDRFCEAMIAIRGEIRAIETGKADREDNVLKGAPHTAFVVAATEWSHKYSREQAAFPTRWTRERKFWPHVGRIDNVWGDRNLMCLCPPVEEAERAQRIP